MKDAIVFALRRIALNKASESALAISMCLFALAFWLGESHLFWAAVWFMSVSLICEAIERRPRPVKLFMGSKSVHRNDD